MPSTSRPATAKPKRTLSLWTMFVGVVALTALILNAANGSSSAAQEGGHVVQIETMRFSPDVVRVQVGERVVFKNADLVPHTVTAAEQHVDSGTLESGKSWSLTCERPGEIAYHCTFHPTMTGRILVSPRR